MVRVGEHYRSTGGAVEPGVYRVVGTGEEIALLRVSDGDGRRIHSGHVASVSPKALEDGFEPADNPDAGGAPVRALRNALAGLYWGVRRLF